MTRICYEDKLVTLFLGDCREITDWLSADILVTDPPFGISWSRGALCGRGDRRGGNKIAGDSGTGLRDWVLEQWGSKRAIVFGSLKLAPPEGTKKVLVYQKPPDAGRWGTIAGYRHDLEAIYLLGDWGPAKVGQGRSSLLTTDVQMTSGAYGYTARQGHPHAKPVDMLKQLLSGIEEPGVIADPFAGSGSVLLAARELGLRALGVEIDEQYARRAANLLSQPSLWDPT